MQLWYVAITTVGYNYVCVNSDHLHVWGELFGQIGAHCVQEGSSLQVIERAEA